jgi:hypothetical protein
LHAHEDMSVGLSGDIDVLNPFSPSYLTILPGRLHDINWDVLCSYLLVMQTRKIVRKSFSVLSDRVWETRMADGPSMSNAGFIKWHSMVSSDVVDEVKPTVQVG